MDALELNVHVFARQYATEQEAADVFARAVREFVEAGEEISVFRGMTPDQATHIVSVVDGSGCTAGFEWGGEEYELDDNERKLIVQRRLRALLEGYLETGCDDIYQRGHYGPAGVVLKPGGTVEPYGGGDRG